MSIVSIPQSSALLFDTDSYKVSMPMQYPPGTEIVSSYITSRGGEYTDVMLAGVNSSLRPSSRLRSLEKM